MTTDRRTRLKVNRPQPWGDVNPQWRPETVGRTARAAEAPWRLHDDPRVPDTVTDSGSLGPVEVLAVSTRGSSHRHYGTRREDAVAVAEVADRHIVVAVADGVGSIPDSHEASHRAVWKFVHEMAKGLTGTATPTRELLTNAVNEVCVDLTESGVPGKTTLLVAVVDVAATDEPVFQLARVGDSPAFALGAGEFVDVFEVPDETDLHSTATNALPTEGPVRGEYAEGRLAAGEALFLTSDGIGNLLAVPEVRARLAETWRRGPPPLTRFVTDVELRRKSFDDDRTVVGLWVPHRRSVANTTGRLTGAIVTEYDDYVRSGGCLSAGRLNDLEVRAASICGSQRQDRVRRDTAAVVAMPDHLAAVVTRTHTVDDGYGGDGYLFSRHFLGKLADYTDEPIEQRIMRALRETDEMLARIIYAAGNTAELSALIVESGDDLPSRRYWSVTAGEQDGYLVDQRVQRLSDVDTTAVAIPDFSFRFLRGPLVVRRGHLSRGQVLLAVSGVRMDQLESRLVQVTSDTLRPPGEDGGANFGPLEFFSSVHAHAADESADSTAVAIWLDKGNGK